MKLTAHDSFSFTATTQNGKFAVNPTKAEEKDLFCIFTHVDRDMELGNNLISWPGEYEFGNVAIQTFALPNKKLGAKMFTEEVRLLFLPALEAPLSEDEMEVFGNIDVLVVEIDEMKPTWKKMIEEIDPKAVIPVGAGQEKALAEMGSGNIESSKDFTFSSSSLPSDQTTYVKLISS